MYKRDGRPSAGGRVNLRCRGACARRHPPSLVSDRDPRQWQNPQVPLDALPAVDDSPFEPLDPRYLSQQRTGWAILLVPLMVGGIVVTVLAGAPSWLPAIVVAVPITLFALAWRLEGLAFGHRGVQLRRFDVSTRRGVISRTTTSVPFSRVQHVTVQRGVLNRLFGLSTVVIYTAGAVSVDAKVDGLDPERADWLRQDIINRSSQLRPRTTGDASTAE